MFLSVRQLKQLYAVFLIVVSMMKDNFVFPRTHIFFFDTVVMVFGLEVSRKAKLPTRLRNINEVDTM